MERAAAAAVQTKISVEFRGDHPVKSFRQLKSRKSKKEGIIGIR